jgi:hypothetical protein
MDYKTRTENSSGFGNMEKILSLAFPSQNMCLYPYTIHTVMVTGLSANGNEIQTMENFSQDSQS